MRPEKHCVHTEGRLRPEVALPQPHCWFDTRVCHPIHQFSNYAYYRIIIGASLVAQMVKHLLAIQEIQVQSLIWEDPLEKEMATHSVLLPGESHGWRSLIGYSPWGCKESDMTEQLHFLSYRIIECNKR